MPEDTGMGIVGKPRRWGNALYVDLGIGESFQYGDKTVRLQAIRGQYCEIDVDGETASLPVARLDLPQVVNGVRIFVSDNRTVADLTPNHPRRPNLHGALSKDALLCLSNPSQPLLDPDRYAFPIDRADGYEWIMGENSHMFAYLHEWRSHEGVDLDLHEARGLEKHVVVAMEDGVIRWIDTIHTRKHEACILLESATDPGIFYAYQHLNAEKLLVKTGDTIQRGQPLAYIWGDDVWGHLHFGVMAYGQCPKDYIEAYEYVINIFPQLYELWHGDLKERQRLWPSGVFLFDRHRATIRNRKALNGYRDFLGYGWLLGDWCPADQVENVTHFEKLIEEYDSSTNARLRKTMFAGSSGEATNPDDYYVFEIAVPPGEYVVKALVGDLDYPSWQHVYIEGVDAGEFALEANRFAWTPSLRLPVTDGKLTVRIDVQQDNTVAGLAELVFTKYN